MAFVLDLLMLSGGHLDAVPGPRRDWAASTTPRAGRCWTAAWRWTRRPRASRASSVGGNTYLYFGPVLSLLRLPVLAVTHGLDGRLTLMSMVLGFAALLAAGGVAALAGAGSWPPGHAGGALEVAAVS